MSSLKEQISYELIDAWKPVFDAYPELTALPVYAWGRYYKYECAGSPFETYWDEDGVYGFKQMISENLQWELIEKINGNHNQYEDGKNELWDGTWGDYSPDREKVVRAWNFDDRAGMCLVIEKNNDDFEVKAYKCDSPE